MPCDERVAAEVKKKQMEALMKKLKDKSIKLGKVGSTLTINGWVDRSGWCDVCAVRKLKMSADQTIRKLVAEAEKATVSVGR